MKSNCERLFLCVLTLNFKKYLLPSLKIPRCSPPGSVLWKFTDFTGKQIHAKNEFRYNWTLKTQILAGGLCQRHPCKCVLLKRCSKICSKIYRKSTVSESFLKRDSRRGVFLWFLENFSGQVFGEALLLLFLSTFYFRMTFRFNGSVAMLIKADKKNVFRHQEWR